MAARALCELFVLMFEETTAPTVKARDSWGHAALRKDAKGFLPLIRAAFLDRDVIARVAGKGFRLAVPIIPSEHYPKQAPPPAPVKVEVPAVSAKGKEKQVASPAAVSLPPPETYAQAVVRAINTAKAKQAHADKMNRAKMAELSAAAAKVREAKKEAELKARYAEGYVPLAQRKKIAVAKATVKKAKETGQTESVLQKAAGVIHPFVKYSAKQMKEHQSAVLARTGAARWFSAAERKAFQAMSPQAKAAARLVAEEQARKLRAAKKQEVDTFRAQRKARDEARADQLVKRAACVASGGHKWKKDSSHVNSLRHCSECGVDPQGADWCRAYGRHSFKRVVSAKYPTGRECCYRCGTVKACTHNVVGPDYVCLGCGEQQPDTSQR